jgi:hypothetical protein
MAIETFYSPKAPVRYPHLVNAGFFKDSWSYSVELILTNANPIHQAFLGKLESEFVALYGTKRQPAENGKPWLSLGNGTTRVKFKTKRFENGDGTFSKGPLLVDAKKQPWNGQEIGNGSEMIIGFTIKSWKGDVGVSFHPKACQVVSFVPRNDTTGEEAAEGFEEQEGGYAVADASGYVDEFAEEEAPF